MRVWIGNNKLERGEKMNVEATLQANDDLASTTGCQRQVVHDFYLIYACKRDTAMGQRTRFVTLQHPVPDQDWFLTELDLVYADNTTCECSIEHVFLLLFSFSFYISIDQ